MSALGGVTQRTQSADTERTEAIKTAAHFPQRFFWGANREHLKTALRMIDASVRSVSALPVLCVPTSASTSALEHDR